MLARSNDRSGPAKPERVRSRVRAAMVGFPIAAGSALVPFACGGTTGEPELAPVVPQMTDATVQGLIGEGGGEGGEAGDDGGIYTGLFDVTITYTDRDLPEITPAPSSEAGADSSGFPFPTTCPPYITVMGHNPVPISYGGTDEVPADPTSDGGSTFAADGSVCLYPWIDSPTIDDCTTQVFVLQGSTYPAFPPCNWCPPGSGGVTQGPNPGEDRTLACWTLYQCMMKSQCYLGQLGACLCGSESIPTCETDPNPPGACATEELEALETTDLTQALQSYVQASAPGVQGATCGSALNNIFQYAVAWCLPNQGDP
jgi:hypothetical protein